MQTNTPIPVFRTDDGIVSATSARARLSAPPSDHPLATSSFPTVFRELRNAAELEVAARLRARGTIGLQQKQIVRPPIDGIELDAWDLGSRHFGLWRGVDLVGYIRIVTGAESAIGAAVLQVAQGNGLLDRVLETVTHRLPSYAYFSELRAHQYLEDQPDLYEASRLVVDPELAGRCHGSQLIQATSAVFLTLEKRRGIANVDARHTRAYRRLGFETVPQIRKTLPDGSVRTLVLSRWQHLPSARLWELEDLCDQWCRGGAISWRRPNARPGTSMNGGAPTAVL